jgi:hypothetical protein
LTRVLFPGRKRGRKFFPRFLFLYFQIEINAAKNSFNVELNRLLSAPVTEGILNQTILMLMFNESVFTAFLICTRRTLVERGFNEKIFDAFSFIDGSEYRVFLFNGLHEDDESGKYFVG